MSALPRRSQRPASHLGIASLLAVLAVTAIGCSRSDGKQLPVADGREQPRGRLPVHHQPAGREPLRSPRRSLRDVVGKYDGAFNGTFTLTWTQKNSKLTGSIELSTAGTLNLNGVVTGNAIQFGTVGSTAITYSGTVSGDSMSGTYQVNGSSGGNWSATKTS